MNAETRDLLQYRLSRMTMYGEQFDDWAEQVRELLDEDESEHDTCASQDRLNDLECENESLRDEVGKLQDKLTRKGQTKARQKLLDRIDQLEGELSDAKADISSIASG